MKVRAKVKTTKPKAKTFVSIQMSEEVASHLMAYLDNAAVWMKTGKPGQAAEDVWEALSDAGVDATHVSEEDREKFRDIAPW